MTTPAAFDIGILQRSDSTTVEILHPATGDATGMKVVVYGVDSATYRDADRALRNRRLHKLQHSGRQTKITAEGTEADGLELLVRCTASWEGFMENGQLLPFTKDNARRVYEEHRWLRRQVDEAVTDAASFFGKSPSNSSASPSTNSD
ncbi:hypothetical protein JKA73_17570 [Myxococcus xanthus]|uniref:hypothetical protein n=1 Tax=Myxococcus xanthus TaxID=34 RepID=UPI0019174D3A|nr:hypothetical protein [Myxococcus xanthus]QQR47746.1 hypothetical protein JKA73_17570 [Myxococcus xanthus]